MQSIYELIQAARRRIAAQPYVPVGAYSDEDGNHCALGAVFYEAKIQIDTIPLPPNVITDVAYKVAHTLCPNSGSPMSCLFAINDEEGREGVLRLFDEWLANNAPVTQTEEVAESLVTV